MLTPFKYQLEAVQAMHNKQGFLLADEMGLGKTATVLLDAKQHSAQTILVVCPKSAKSTWTRHVPLVGMGHKVISFIGTPAQRAKAAKELTSVVSMNIPVLCIVNYESVKRNPALFDAAWDYLILDEAHYIKNRKAERTKWVKKIRAKYRRAVTGTPIINKPFDIWSILHFLHPKEYSSYWRFFKNYVDYDINIHGYYEIKGPNLSKMPELQAKLGTLYLQRDKKTAAPELPEKYWTPVDIELTPQQKRVYEAIVKDDIVRLPDGSILYTDTPLAARTRLKQIAVGMLEGVQDSDKFALCEPSAKLDWVSDWLDTNDEPVVIFTQFKQALDLLTRRLDADQLSYCRIDGSTPQRHREALVDRFQAGKARVFAATMQTAGVAIELYHASNCIFLDRHESPAINAQAEDRLHRTGQKNPVQIIKLLVNGSVDEDVEVSNFTKQDWARKVLPNGKL